MKKRLNNWDKANLTVLLPKVAYTTDDIELKPKHNLPSITYTVKSVVVTLTDDHANRIFLGVARCSPNDNYSAKIGRDIAAGRALKLLQDNVYTADIIRVSFEGDEDTQHILIAETPEDADLFFRIKNKE